MARGENAKFRRELPVGMDRCVSAQVSRATARGRLETNAKLEQTALDDCKRGSRGLLLLHTA